MTNEVADAPLEERTTKVRELISGIVIAMMTTIDESGCSTALRCSHNRPTCRFPCTVSKAGFLAVVALG